MANRSVRDLRELICVSRLSGGNNEEDEGIGTGSSSSSPPRTSPTTPDSFKPTPPLSALIKHRFPKAPPLPPVNQVYKLDEILEYIDIPLLSTWLDDCNAKVDELAIWCKENFVAFAHFWLNNFDNDKKVDILELEMGIVIDTFKVLFKTDLKKIQLNRLCQATLKEYPQSLLSQKGYYLFLDYLIILTSGRTEDYRQLLSDVKIVTDVKTFAQAALGLRAYQLISIWYGIISFYRKISKPLRLLTARTRKSIADQSEYNQKAMMAIQLDYDDVLKYLLKTKKISATDLDKSGRSLGFFATINGSENCLKTLIEAGFDVKTKSNSGNSLLHSAVTSGKSQILELILNCKNVDVNCINEQSGNATPLHNAILDGKEEIIEILIKFGANPQLKVNGQTAVELANDLGHYHLIKYLSIS